ncbi:MAG: hypothetical protein AAB899_03820 [Patescibacteria group bacterium]
MKIIGWALMFFGLVVAISSRWQVDDKVFSVITFGVIVIISGVIVVLLSESDERQQ